MEKLRIGIAGLGRLGKLHADNIANRVRGAELTAACSIVPDELEYAKEKLGVKKVYLDYREMIRDPDIDAVVIVTTSREHCWQIEPPWMRVSTFFLKSLSAQIWSNADWQKLL